MLAILSCIIGVGESVRLALYNFYMSLCVFYYTGFLFGGWRDLSDFISVSLSFCRIVTVSSCDGFLKIYNNRYIMHHLTNSWRRNTNDRRRDRRIFCLRYLSAVRWQCIIVASYNIYLSVVYKMCVSQWMNASSVSPHSRLRTVVRSVCVFVCVLRIVQNSNHKCKCDVLLMCCRRALSGTLKF